MNIERLSTSKFVTIVLLCSTALLNTHAFAQDNSAAQGTASYDDGFGVYNEATYGSKETLARVWELSSEEIDRFYELKMKDRHFSSEQISPIEVLGKYARSEEEGRRYAAKYVELMKEQSTNTIEWRSYVQQAERDSMTKYIHDLVAGSIATKQEFAKADMPLAHFRNELRDEELGIDKSPAAKMARMKKPDVRFFVDVNDCDSDCSALWDKLRGEQTLDVYGMLAVIFVNKPSQEQIRQWVVDSGITEGDLDLLKVRLDHENEVYAKFRGENPAPYAIDTSRNVIQ